MSLFRDKKKVEVGPVDLKSMVGSKVIVSEETADGGSNLYFGLVCALHKPGSTAWIKPEIEESGEHGVSGFGVMRYASSNEIDFVQGEFYSVPAFLGVLGISRTLEDRHLVTRDNNINGCLFDNFSEYLAEAGIKAP